MSWVRLPRFMVEEHYERVKAARNAFVRLRSLAFMSDKRVLRVLWLEEYLDALDRLPWEAVLSMGW